MEPTASMALRAARKAGDLIVRASDDMDRVGYQAKAAADFVTEVDIAAEKEILYQLGKAYPEHRFLCEESGLSGNEDSDYTWVIDPLDGTSNFLRGIPHYAISIACLHRGKIEHAVVYDPVRREEFIASRGRGAQLNGHRIQRIFEGVSQRNFAEVFVAEILGAVAGPAAWSIHKNVFRLHSGTDGGCIGKELEGGSR